MDLSLCSLSRVWIVWKPSLHRPRTIWALEPAIGSPLTTVHHLTCEPCFRECLFIVHTCYYHLSSPFFSSTLLLLFPLPPTPLPPPSRSTTPSVALGIIVILVVLQLMYTFFQRTGTVGQTGRSSSSFNPFVSHLPQHLVLQ